MLHDYAELVHSFAAQSGSRRTVIHHVLGQRKVSAYNNFTNRQEQAACDEWNDLCVKSGSYPS